MTDKNLIYILLLSLQNTVQSTVAYCPKEQMFVLVGERDESGQIPLYPLGSDTSQIIWTSSTSRLVFPPKELLQLKRSGQTSNKQAPTNDYSDIDHDLTRETTSVQTDFEQRSFKREPRTKQEIISYYRLVDFSSFLPKGYLRDLSKEIFSLTVKTLHTRNQKVIDEVLELYDKAMKLSDNPNHKDLNQLRKIKARLQTIYNRQQSANHNREEYKRRQSVKRKVLIFSFVALFSLLLVYFGLSGSKAWSFTRNFTQKSEQLHKILLTYSTVEQAIDNYEMQNNTRVWQWRRDKIHEQLDGKEITQETFDKMLDSLINKSWK